MWNGRTSFLYGSVQTPNKSSSKKRVSCISMEKIRIITFESKVSESLILLNKESGFSAEEVVKYLILSNIVLNSLKNWKQIISDFPLSLFTHVTDDFYASYFQVWPHAICVIPNSRSDAVWVVMNCYYSLEISFPCMCRIKVVLKFQIAVLCCDIV